MTLKLTTANKSPPNSSDRNLDYQFYFLLRTHWWQDEKYVYEPFEKFGTLETIGIQIDTDKRLFRRNAPAQTPLANWQIHLKAAWDNICETYRQAISPRNPEQGMDEAWQFCQDNLLGVALIIMDADLQRHEITLDLYGSANHKLGKSCFSYDAETVLFSIRDKAGEMPAPATFHAFTPSIDKWALKNHNWSLRFDKSLPYLMQIESTAQQNYPVFVVYGLAHGDALAALEQDKTWPTALQDVLCGTVGKGQPLKTTAILNSIIARLLISEAVFETLDSEATELRFELQRKTAHYFATPDKTIEDTPNSVLEDQLREIESLMAKTDYALGRLSQAIKTLEINQENFKWRLSHQHHEETEWQLDWQSGSQYPSLLEPLYIGLENIKNHVAYINGKLIHLKGAGSRWRSYVAENRQDLTEHLGHVGNIIILLLALGELFRYNRDNEGFGFRFLDYFATALNNPTTYLVIITFFFLFVLRHYGKQWLKWLKYKFRQSTLRG